MAALLAILLALVSVFVSTRGVARSPDRGAHGPRPLPVTGWGRVLLERIRHSARHRPT